MPRRREIPKRVILPDPLYHNEEVAKFINVLMLEGKKAVAERILYGAFEQIKGKSGKDPIEVFQFALSNCRPMVEVKSRRVGGANYQVPIEVRPIRRTALAGGFLQPAHGQSQAADWAHFDWHLVVGAADTAGLHFDHRLDVVDGQGEGLNRVFAGVLLLDEFEGTINDALCNSFLAAFHDHVHEFGQLYIAELRIRQDFTFRDFATTWHFFTSCFASVGVLADTAKTIMVFTYSTHSGSLR
jgi:ribosomal protein S7